MDPLSAGDNEPKQKELQIAGESGTFFAEGLCVALPLIVRCTAYLSLYKHACAVFLRVCVWWVLSKDSRKKKTSPVECGDCKRRKRHR